ncbi:DUF2231 domain-containing protein [Bradyrhizobium sp.]|jgi:uncharacterized membrane protein|uniref:DUF2231 domain-containing protein n=1 Tax=Bradyrhizobium sp. TaxID=376 RepID=UPI002DFD03C5|nr:DUF2231 domain-containing protein [Bradyrhizobium sp.]
MQQHATIAAAPLIRNNDFEPIPRHRARPVHSMLASFSAAYFAGALVTDVVYWQMPDVMWERFSIWLIMAGLVMAGLALLSYIINAFAGRRRGSRSAWPRLVCYALAVCLAVINAFVHSRDGYTAVVPSGLMLSASVVIVLVLVEIATLLANRRRVGE